MCKANNVHYGWYTLSLSMSVPSWKRDAENSPCKVVAEFIKYRRFIFYRTITLCVIEILITILHDINNSLTSFNIILMYVLLRKDLMLFVAFYSRYPVLVELFQRFCHNSLYNKFLLNTWRLFFITKEYTVKNITLVIFFKIE